MHFESCCYFLVAASIYTVMPYPEPPLKLNTFVPLLHSVMKFSIIKKQIVKVNLKSCKKELGNQISCQNQKQAKSKTETKTSISTKQRGRQTGGKTASKSNNSEVSSEKNCYKCLSIQTFISCQNDCRVR